MIQRFFTSVSKSVLKNTSITAKNIFLISHTGASLGLRKLDSCLSQLTDGFDLIQVSSSSPLGNEIPTVKQFQKTTQKAAKATKSTTQSKSTHKIKKMEMYSNIDSHDQSIKVKKIIGFLEKGNQVRVVITRKRGVSVPVSDLYKELIMDLKGYKCNGEVENSERIEFQEHALQGLPLNSYCVRLLNDKDGSVGCQGKYGNSKGILWRISSQEQLISFVAKRESLESYVLVLDWEQGTKDWSSHLNSILDDKAVTGLIILNNNHTNYLPISMDSKSPNHDYGIYRQEKFGYPWNTNGLDLLAKRFDIPVMFIGGSNSSVTMQTLGTMKEALDFNEQRGNIGWPLYGVEIDALMWAAHSSFECLKSGRCLPLGGDSVWSGFSKITKTDGKGIYVLSAKLDSTSFFHDFSYGAAQRSGLIALLAIADALSKSSTPVSTLPNHILIAFFNNENYGYGGSQRFVHDISTDFVCKSGDGWASCPEDFSCRNPCFRSTDFANISFDSIKGIIDFDTLGLINSDTGPSQYYLHVDKTETTLDLVSKLSGTFSGSFQISVNSTLNFTHGIPPSSLHSFLAKKRSIPGVVVSDYKTEFSNQYYNSELDLGRSWTQSNIDSLCSLSTFMAQKIYSIAGETNSIPSEINANCSFVSQLLDCFTRNINCTYIQDILNYNAVISLDRFSGYPGVTTSPGRSQATVYSSLVSRILNTKTSSPIRVCNGTNNGTGYPTLPCQGTEKCIAGFCYTSMVQNHDSYGLGLWYNGNEWRVRDSSLNTWTESTWDTTRMRLSLFTSIKYQWMEFSIGIIITILFSVMTVRIRRKIMLDLQKNQIFKE